MYPIHAIQTGTVAIKQKQREGQGEGAVRRLNTLLDTTWTERLPIYAWIIEHPEGLIVIDTGETARATTPGYFTPWHPYFRWGVKEWVEPEQEIGPQMQRLGLAPRDVRWVVMTHMHTDHAGGMGHFPQSEFVLSHAEHQVATGFKGKVNGYLPQHWPSWFLPRLIDFKAKTVGPFPESLTLTQAGDVHLVSTPGHSVGHLSVILQNDAQQYFFAGDTSYTEQLMLDQKIDGVAPVEQAARTTLARILQYVRETSVVYLPSHDPESSKRLSAHQTAGSASATAHS